MTFNFPFLHTKMIKRKMKYFKKYIFRQEIIPMAIVLNNVCESGTNLYTRAHVWNSGI